MNHSNSSGQEKKSFHGAERKKRHSRRRRVKKWKKDIKYYLIVLGVCFIASFILMIATGKLGDFIHKTVLTNLEKVLYGSMATRG